VQKPRSPLKAVVVGSLTDLGGSLGAGQILLLVYGVWLAADGLSVPELEEAMTHIEAGSGIMLAGNVIGTLFSWLGGYVCARLAPAPELKWAGVVAAISLGAGFALGMDYPLPLLVLLSLVSAAAVMVGGWMGRARNAQTRAVEP
jgi:hypothetical protein